MSLNNLNESDFPDIEFLNLRNNLLPGEKPEISEFKRLENNGNLLPEPLLTEDKSRFVLFPIKHNDVKLKLLLSFFIFFFLIFFLLLIFF